jgi:hypothetical protein
MGENEQKEWWTINSLDWISTSTQRHKQVSSVDLIIDNNLSIIFIPFIDIVQLTANHWVQLNKTNLLRTELISLLSDTMVHLETMVGLNVSGRSNDRLHKSDGATGRYIWAKRRRDKWVPIEWVCVTNSPFTIFTSIQTNNFRLVVSGSQKKCYSRSDNKQ